MIMRELMRIVLPTTAGGLIAVFPVLSQPKTWFTDTFQFGNPGTWRAVTGKWRIVDSTMTIDASGYDHMLACSTYVYGYEPCTIEATFRGSRAGIFFNLDDTTSKALAHMVRFDEKTLLSGYFTGGGEFIATNSFELSRGAANWTTLRIELDPVNRRYTIAVDDSVIGVDTVLRFPSGFAGLQASEGRAEFRSFTIRGNEIQQSPPPLKIGDAVPLRHIRDLRQGDGNTVYDPERNAFLSLDEGGKLIRQHPATHRPEPPSGTVCGDRKYVIKGRVVFIQSLAGTVVDSITERLVAPAAVVALNESTVYIADAGANAVFLFGREGRHQKSFKARAHGGFIAPRGMGMKDSRTLMVADYDRLVLVPVSLEENEAQVSTVSPTGVTISWPSGAAPAQGRLTYAADGGEWKIAEATVSRNRSMQGTHLTGLLPLRRYTFKVTPVGGAIPPGPGYSHEHRFSTPPADTATMAITRIPVMCLIYRTISYRDVYPANTFEHIPWGRTMTAEELDDLRAACAFNRSFYYRNSSCRVVLDFDIHVVEDTLHLLEVGENDPYWLSITERVTRDFEQAAIFAGHEPAFYNGLIVPYAWVNYPPRRTSALRDSAKTDSINIRQMYGGGTYGVPAPWKYGMTSGYTGNPFQDRFSRQDWLMTHEFHHQIDALMEASGYPEYYHADQPWKMPGRFGEDFDFNARIIRKADPTWWLNLKFGKLVQTGDADRDGVPDNDRSLPFDERELGGDTSLADTDGDGLADLAETMAGNASGSSLTIRDTDADGIDDGVDPEPLYPFPPAIPKLASSDSPLLETVSAQEFAHADSLTTFHLAWDDSSLYAGYTRVVSPTDSIGFLLQIDAANDGWFHGFDNTQIRIRRSESTTTVVDYYLRDCSSWSDPPADRKDILRKEDVSVLTRTQPRPDGSLSVTLVARIPGNVPYGPDLRLGRRMAIRLGLQTLDDRWVWNELFERNYMMSVRLAEAP
jgi:hypothetical protein